MANSFLSKALESMGKSKSKDGSPNKRPSQIAQAINMPGKKINELKPDGPILSTRGKHEVGQGRLEKASSRGGAAAIKKQQTGSLRIVYEDGNTAYFSDGMKVIFTEGKEKKRDVRCIRCWDVVERVWTHEERPSCFYSLCTTCVDEWDGSPITHSLKAVDTTPGSNVRLKPGDRAADVGKRSGMMAETQWIGDI